MRLQRLRDWFATSFWAYPAAVVVVLGLLSASLTAVDGALRGEGVRFAFAAGPDTARSLLGVISSSTLTLAGLTFSVTLVVLVMASGQYSPRVLRTFLRDRRTKAALGIFLGTYVYALVALRAVSTAEDADPFVPGLTITGAFLLALAAIGTFTFFINHVVQSVRVEHIIGRIAADTRTAIEQLHPPDLTVPRGRLPGAVVAVAVGDHVSGDLPMAAAPAPHPGVIASVDIGDLLARAVDADVSVALHHSVGTFVPRGAPLLTVIGTTDRDPETFVAAIELTATRTVRQDVAFGFRQLVDIAERALSPGVNDPTTAVQALDQLHDLLRRLATRPLHDGSHPDDDGVLRVHVPMPTWTDYVDLALDEIRHWGSGSIQVHHRVGALIDDLLTVVDADRAETLRAHRALLEARAEADLSDVERAAAASPTGD